MAIGLLNQDGRRAAPADVDRVPQTVVAVRQILVWPSQHGEDPEASQHIRPELCLVLEDQAKVTDARLRMLLDLVEDRRGTARATALSGTCVWSLRQPWADRVRLAVRAAAPIWLNVDIVLPTHPLLGALRRLSRGGTIALITTRQADQLRSGRGAQNGLTCGVLVPCPPSTVLAGLACQAEEPEPASPPHRLTSLTG
jgi:hypothetical protein